MRLLFLVLLLICSLAGNSLEERYPSYRYVFSEFDIDESYLDNPEFIQFVGKNEKKIKHFYEQSLKRGAFLLPLLQKRLMDGGLTDLFIYLSMVESGFSPKITSSKKAVGLWQFMPATAKAYNMTVCEGIDERCDPVTSTEAAITYLEKLHKQFGKWYLAMMAYNCGEGRMKKAIIQAGTDALEVLTDGQMHYLPKETRFYIKKILLAAMIGENITLGFGQMPKVRTQKGLMRVYVRGGELWLNIAKLLEMEVSELKRLNPAYYSTSSLPKEKKRYAIMIPEDKIYAFYLRYEIEHHQTIPEKVYMISYTVRLGDTLERIGEYYGSNPEEIKRVNHLNRSYLEVGKLLIIPVSKERFENYIEDTE